jgi:hypothetical protein
LVLPTDALSSEDRAEETQSAKSDKPNKATDHHAARASGYEPKPRRYEH